MHHGCLFPGPRNLQECIEIRQSYSIAVVLGEKLKQYYMAVHIHAQTHSLHRARTLPSTPTISPHFSHPISSVMLPTLQVARSELLNRTMCSFLVSSCSSCCAQLLGYKEGQTTRLHSQDRYGHSEWHSRAPSPDSSSSRRVTPWRHFLKKPICLELPSIMQWRQSPRSPLLNASIAVNMPRPISMHTS